MYVFGCLLMTLMVERVQMESNHAAVDPIDSSGASAHSSHRFMASEHER